MTGDQLDVPALLSEQLDRLFTAQIERPMRRAVEAEGDYPAEIWSAAEDSGVNLAMADETVGGGGLSWAQAEPILRKLGEHAAPVPLGETMLASWALSLAGMDIPVGPIAIAASPFDWSVDGRVSGEEALIAWPAAGKSLLIVAHGQGRARLCRIESKAAVWSERATYARIPSAALRLNAVQPVQVADCPAALGPLGLLPALAVLRSVQMAGALDHILGLCVEYAKSRVQFGKPIGKFQAIQQMLAELAGHAAAAQVAGLYGCRRMDAPLASAGAAVAKIRVGMAATRGAAIAHQVFGAIGITDEHELHYYTRRLWQWRTEGGSDHSWSERLGGAALANGGARLWSSVVGGV